MKGPDKTAETVEALKQMMEEQAAQHANQIARLLAIIVDLTAHPPPQREHSPPNPTKSQNCQQQEHCPPNSTKSQSCPQSAHAQHNTPSISTLSNHPNYRPSLYPKASASNTCSIDRAKNTYHPRRQPRQFAPLDVPRDVMFQMLVKTRILEPLQPVSPPAQLSRNHQSDLYCEYHQHTGHTTLTCHSLAHKIQDLIDRGTIPPPTKPSAIPKPIPRQQVGNPNSTESLTPTEPILDQSVQATTEQTKPTTPPAANALEAEDVDDSISPTMEAA